MRDINKEKNKFFMLEAETRRIEAMENKVEAMVKLFELVYPIEEKGLFIVEALDLRRQLNHCGLFCHEIEALEKLRKYFCDIGYSKYVSSISKEEQACAKRIMLGGVFGLKYKSAKYCLDMRPELEKELQPQPPRGEGDLVSKWYLINDCQCGTFIRTYTQSILKQIKTLKVV